MEKNNKKDIEQLLIKQTEKIFSEIDPAASVIFSKHVKSHCKDLAKKFLKTQKKIQKQIEAITNGAVNEIAVENKTAISKSPLKRVKVTAKTGITPKNKTTAKPSVKLASNEIKTKAPTKKIRRGNNLFNAGLTQKKAKASLVKTITKSSK
jgi:hypothetical protein